MSTKLSMIGATLILTTTACAHVESKETPSANAVSTTAKVEPTAGGATAAPSKDLLPYQAPATPAQTAPVAASEPAQPAAAEAKQNSPDSPPVPREPAAVTSAESKSSKGAAAKAEAGGAPARFVLTRGIQEREPIDEVTTFKPGERMYAFLEVGNEEGGEYSLNVRWAKGDGEAGQAPTPVTIGASPHWRTWSFRTAPQQSGSYLCRVETDQGVTLAEIPFKVEAI